MFTIIIILTLVVVVLVAALMKRPAEEIDPHEGQVYINDGFGMVWMTPLEGVDVNNISQSDIVRYDGVPKYVGEGYETLRGVDVSEHQYDIDWAAVAASGVDFAYIRLGYRGYTQGGLFEDAYFKANIEGAKSNGIKVGVYFFSQAINVQEAIEEADFVLERIEQYDIDLPVMYDWEKMEEAGAKRFRVEGYGPGRWIVCDYGDVLVHIFHEQEREYYHMERLWMDGTNQVEVPEE